MGMIHDAMKQVKAHGVLLGRQAGHTILAVAQLSDTLSIREMSHGKLNHATMEVVVTDLVTAMPSLALIYWSPIGSTTTASISTSNSLRHSSATTNSRFARVPSLSHTSAAI